MLTSYKVISQPNVPELSQGGRNSDLKLPQPTVNISLECEYDAKLFHMLHTRKWRWKVMSSLYDPFQINLEKSLGG